MTRLAAVVALAVAVVTSACTPGRAAIVAGAGTLMLGGMSYAAGAPNSTCTGESSCGVGTGVLDSFSDGFNEGQRDLGGAMMLTGAALLVVGLIAETRRANDEPAPTSAVVFTPAQRVIGAPGAVVISEGPAVERTATPAEMAIRSRIENRLAIQASLAARRGDCLAAVATTVRLAEVDPTMHAELVRTDADLAYCLARAAAPQY